MKIKHSRQAHDGLVASFPHGNQFQYKGGKRRCRLRISPYNQGSIRHLFIVAYRPLSFSREVRVNIIFLFCQIHRNGYPLLALRESIRHHSVPKLTASLVLYAPPIHLHGYHEEYVVCILMVGYHFLPIWLWLFLVLLSDSHAFCKALKPCQIFWLYQTYTLFS